MRGASLTLGLWLVLSGGSVEVHAQEFDHSPWDHVLKEFVNEQGRVDYAALKASPAELDRYVRELAAQSPVSHPQNFPTRQSQLAYWVNAYNALVMKGVVDHWPVESVRKIGGLPYSFFWRKKFVVGERKYTLDAIEGIMRENWPSRAFTLHLFALRTVALGSSARLTPRKTPTNYLKRPRAFISTNRAISESTQSATRLP